MKFIKTNKSKTFLAILLNFSIVLLIVLIIFSTLIYYSFEKNILKKTYESNERTLSLLGYNINSVNEEVRTFCISEFYNEEIYKLINLDSIDNKVITDGVNSIKNSVSSNAKIHSAIIYNSDLNEFYSTYTPDGKIYMNDENLRGIVDKNEEVKLLFPVPRILPEEGYNEETEVFTYFMFDAIDRNSRMKGGLIVNVKTNWLFETLQRLKSEESNLIIINRKGEIIWEDEGKESLGLLNSDIKEKIFQLSELGDIFIQDVNGEKKVITYLNIPNTGWIMINVEKYQNVFSHLLQIRNNVIFTTLAFIILSLVLALYISKRVYRPLDNIVKIVKDELHGQLPTTGNFDEIQYIRQAINLTSNELNNFNKLKDSVQGILKENILKSLILESNLAEKKIASEYFDEVNKKFNGEGLILIEFKINKYEDFMNLSEEDRKLFKYGIQNIANEILSSCSKVELVDIGNDILVAILNIPMSATNKFNDNVTSKVKDIQHHVKNILDVSLTAIISRKATKIQDLSICYREIKKVEKEKIFYHNFYILHVDEVFKRIQNLEISYPYDIEKKLVDSLKEGNIKIVEEIYKEFISNISSTGFDNFMLNLMNLTVALQRVVNEINSVSMHDIDVDIFHIYNEAMRKDSIKEINDLYINLFTKIIEHKRDKTEDKHNFLINSIKDYIKLNYYQSSLNLKEIAAEFSMSSVYLGKIFKNVTNVSLSQYINDVRIRKTANLLLEKKYSIKEIMDKVGFENESTFYKAFKKNYGVTPSQFRASVSANRMLNTD